MLLGSLAFCKDIIHIAYKLMRWVITSGQGYDETEKAFCVYKVWKHERVELKFPFSLVESLSVYYTEQVEV